MKAPLNHTHKTPRSLMARIVNFISSKKHYNYLGNYQYGSDLRQCLDIYLPHLTTLDNTHTNGIPMVIFFHGGSWKNGDKQDYLFLADSLCRLGYGLVVPNYRLAPTYLYPNFIEDSVSAIRYVHQNIKTLGGDSEKMIVMGHSAGAFNAVTSVYDKRFLTDLNVLNAIKAVIGISGPYDYDFKTDATVDVFPANETQSSVMPVHHLRDTSADYHIPVYLLTAQSDTLVKDYNTHHLIHALTMKHLSCSHLKIANVNHYTIMGAMAYHLRFLGNTRQEISTILDNHFK